MSSSVASMTSMILPGGSGVESVRNRGRAASVCAHRLVPNGSRARELDEGDAMTMTANETRPAKELREEGRFDALLGVRAAERDLGRQYSRTVLRVDRMIAEELAAGTSPIVLGAALGLSVTLIEERAGRHWLLVG